MAGTGQFDPACRYCKNKGMRGNANDSVWKGTYFWLTILSKKNFALTILGRARPTNYIGPGRRPAITILGWAGGPQTILGRRPTNYIGPQAHKLYWAAGPQTILGRRPTNYIGPHVHKLLYWHKNLIACTLILNMLLKMSSLVSEWLKNALLQSEGCEFETTKRQFFCNVCISVSFLLKMKAEAHKLY